MKICMKVFCINIIGEMINDLKEGSGNYFYQNGEKYEGMF